MKKLVFTALAVVAFSVSAMAGTKEVKKAKVAADDCYTKAMNYITNVYDPNGTKTNQECEAAYQGYLQGCYDGGKTASISAN
jgi:hypothetical protein